MVLSIINESQITVAKAVFTLGARARCLITRWTLWQRYPWLPVRVCPSTVLVGR